MLCTLILSFLINIGPVDRLSFCLRTGQNAVQASVCNRNAYKLFDMFLFYTLSDTDLIHCSRVPLIKIHYKVQSYKSFPGGPGVCPCHNLRKHPTQGTKTKR